ncbi:glycosyltransferase family protein [Devosia aurantiaca]|uniref:Glycosyl transferase family 1 domain-containing protein n=1 Tax=Devosia aurantiaca TaxID=2714858 RepID=A0A6M1SPX7_9HYPH|nr:glycosyltransferase [Devosia aurantiaca]NGP19278.1 hypothetical protein [Devosia aurantiaca]
MNGRYPVEGKKVLGCFGFLSEYKGIETAVKALRHLPEEYHLLIVGGLHPEGVARHTVEQPYIQKLLAELIGKAAQSNGFRSVSVRGNSKLVERVHFCGPLGNKEFNQVMAACDAVVLPYAEVGQTSSGPAALALDMQQPVYCSRTHCFKELDRFQPGLISFFEIGNYIELAQKLLRHDGELPERKHAREMYLHDHNVERRAQLYIDAAAALLGETRR